MKCNGLKISLVLATAIITNAAGDITEKLAEKGIEIGVGTTNVYQHNVKNGTSTNSNRGDFTGSYDLEINLSLPELLGIDGNIFIHGEGGWPASDGADGSSIESINPANADFIGNRALDIVEVFYEGQLTEATSFAIGKIDFTGFFDASAYANDEACQFLNGALVNNPSIPFPDYSLGAIVSVGLTDSLTVMAGAADGQADGRETGFRTTFGEEDYFFYIAEAAFVPESELAAQYTIGLWYDPQPKACSGSEQEYRDDAGVYFNIDHELIQEADSEGQGLGAFFRCGFTDKKKNDISSFYSFGVQYLGLLAGRDNDAAGIGYANAAISNDTGLEYGKNYEGIIEAYYNCEICPSFHISPDIQYITNPGAGDVNSALVMGIRAQIDF